MLSMLYKFHSNTIQYFCQRKYKQNIFKAKTKVETSFLMPLKHLIYANPKFQKVDFSKHFLRRILHFIKIFDLQKVQKLLLPQEFMALSQWCSTGVGSLRPKLALRAILKAFFL